jgi:methylmalonyl-CoA mutase
MSKRHTLQHPVRVVTAASLYDGHDAAINIMRRVFQAAGAEVIHLGHNRSVLEIVRAAVQEDAQAVAVSSYQGGHVLFFKYMKELLAQRGAGHVKIFGGGGGVIVRAEIEELHAAGIDRIFSPQDGTELGLEGMIDLALALSDYDPASLPMADLEARVLARDEAALGRALTLCERGAAGATPRPELVQLLAAGRASCTPVVGITGTGGSGKSSLTDEILRRFQAAFPDKSAAVVSVDPTKRKSGGALLGDRIRVNSLTGERVLLRSLATRGSGSELSAATGDAVALLKAAGYDLVLLETSGIGQGSSAVVDLADFSIYAMTAEYGAASQLEKIDMIDFADMVVLNKYEKRGSEDALRDVRRQYRRAHSISWEVPDEDLPVFGTVASRFDCNGTNWFFDRLMEALESRFGGGFAHAPLARDAHVLRRQLIPEERTTYLAEIARSVRDYKSRVARDAELLRRRAHLASAIEELDGGHAALELSARRADLERQLHPATLPALEEYRATAACYTGDVYEYTVRGQVHRQDLTRGSLSGTRVPRVALPRLSDEGDLYRFVALENLPGLFPYTAGVFPFKRQGEDPTRQFAGEGPPERTNRRFHYLSRDSGAKRLSTAFDSVTLYGEDPDERPDIFGKVGESGVSICTLDDMKRLYAGFDLSAPNTSVSMTINGPAPMILAMYLNTAIDFAVDRFQAEQGRAPNAVERAELRRLTLSSVRGTVQADILKEDQAQNTCIFSTEFALKLMGDIQEWFIAQQVRNYYSVSISGYHIAEAGANPISQLAFTLANGFTYVEYYLSRGMAVDDFAPNLSFFFSNGLDPEYSVIGRVARRIWAVAMREVYRGNERSQKLKYHIQTSGRSLHAQEMDFNDIRTTLQALLAVYDNCNSLHTNAYDEAVTTPTEESVRRALAIQLIVNHEFGVTKNENPLQGSFFMEDLTELVEEAVLAEFVRLSERGGVLGAMETQYQRGRIQEESMLYELKKQSGELPIMGVNTFLRPGGDEVPAHMELARASDEEKAGQVTRLRDFQAAHAAEAGPALARLKAVAAAGGNIFDELMETVRVASLGQITRALFEVGGQYRRNM